MKQIIFLFLLLISLISYFTYDNTLKLYNNEDSKIQDKTVQKFEDKNSDIKALPLEKEVFVETKEKNTSIILEKSNLLEEKVKTPKIKETVEEKSKEVKKPDLKKLEQIARKIEPNDEVKKEEKLISKNDLQLQINNIVKNNKITFKRLSSDITTDSYKALEDIAKLLKDYKSAKIEVGGHTDAKGKDDVNKWVSQQRAKSVRKELIKLGISKDRITAVGYGETMPLVPNNKNGYAAENRRVEFKVIEE